MRFPAALIAGRFVRRYKRFLAEIQLPDDRRLWAHVPNTGALTGCLVPGQEVLLTEDFRPGRKTSHTWRFCKAGYHWVCVDTLVPNRLVAEALASPGLPGLPPLLSFRSEVLLPRGERLDFVADLGERLLFMEVKSITWVEDGVALFPDGITSRGRRHLEVLAEIAAQGHEAWQVFVVQRGDADRFRPAAAVDPAYTRELARAAAAGVHILVLQEKVNPPEITLAHPLPFDLY
ncbi:MAG: DNA/RNA nuclease SfsA [Desulfobaccales bacterium]